jgi:hypothetical protein
MAYTPSTRSLMPRISDSNLPLSLIAHLVFVQKAEFRCSLVLRLGASSAASEACVKAEPLGNCQLPTFSRTPSASCTSDGHTPVYREFSFSAFSKKLFKSEDFHDFLIIPMATEIRFKPAIA